MIMRPNKPFQWPTAIITSLLYMITFSFLSSTLLQADSRFAASRMLWIERDPAIQRGDVYKKPWCYEKTEHSYVSKFETVEPVVVKKFTNSLGMKLQWIDGGSFIMGSQKSEQGHWVDESPAHREYIERGFWMGAHEVTQEVYLSVMGTNPSCFKGLHRPVERLTWLEALTFCHELTLLERKNGFLSESQYYTLPTEKQWEYACRSGNQTPFNTGETITSDDANFNGEFSYGNGTAGIFLRRTTDVGHFKANDFGLYDMHGNVDEYCLDCWSEKAPVDPSSAEVKWVAVRGGSCLSLPEHCRSARRDRYGPQTRCCDRGFRVVVASGK